MGIAAAPPPQPCPPGWVKGVRVRREGEGAEVEGEVAEAEEVQELGRDGAAGLPLGDGAQALRLFGGEIELDRRAGDVPGEVLAADQVVGGVVVEGVGLDE